MGAASAGCAIALREGEGALGTSVAAEGAIATALGGGGAAGLGGGVATIDDEPVTATCAGVGES